MRIIKKIIKKTDLAGMSAFQVCLVFFVVIVLLVIIISAFYQARNKSHSTRTMTDMTMLRTALVSYEGEVGKFPDGENIILGEKGANHLCIDGWADECSAVRPPFMLYVPQSFKNEQSLCKIAPGKYLYKQIEGGKNFIVIFCLESSIGTLNAGDRYMDKFGVR